MIKLLVLDDERNELTRIGRLLTHIGLEFVLVTNSADALAVMEAEDAPTMGIFDIELEGDKLSGIEVAKRILFKRKIPIIFLTNYYDSAEYAGMVVGLHKCARNFLPKEVLENQTQFEAELQKAIENCGRTAVQKIAIRTGNGEIRFCGHEEILYVEGDGDNSILHFLNGEKFTFSRNLGAIGWQLIAAFDRVEKLGSSFVVNMDYIQSLEEKTLYFKNKRHINLSEAGVKKLRELVPVIRNR
jgi:DNA-binding LytR/AlgR family response regulator